jgi:hypothetical protein
MRQLVGSTSCSVFHLVEPAMFQVCSTLFHPRHLVRMLVARGRGSPVDRARLGPPVPRSPARGFQIASAS